MSAYRASDLAKRWDCHPTHIYRMIREGRLRAFKIGSLLRVSEAEVGRIECGLNSIVDLGTPSGANEGRQNVSRFAPVIKQGPNGL